ncbi:MAG: DISARM system phospholipase D-like protein DrmC [Bryobacteraceae bacterium]|nr:DISARM system phospholipase D-like protein DrmC [Bryobacteraceae bacterium]
MNPLLSLAATELRTLAGVARAGKLPSLDSAVLGRYVANPAAVACALRKLGSSGASVAALLELLAEAAENRRTVEDACKLVVTGPDDSNSRTTQAVVRQLFSDAGQSVWVCGYRPWEAREIFENLARPSLIVRMLLDVGPAKGRTEAKTVADFLDEFRNKHWPEQAPLPEIWYDPKSLLPDASERGVAHAKCVVTDDFRLFISSANFTEAAQSRNLEAGLLVDSSALARQMVSYLEGLIREGRIKLAANQCLAMSSSPSK